MIQSIARYQQDDITDDTLIEFKPSQVGRAALIVFTTESGGPLTGNVTATARVVGGRVLNPVADGTLDLSTRDYIYIPNIPLSAVHLNYDGGAGVTATVYLMP